MAKNGLAKGQNSGHITTPIESAPKANRRKGVSRLDWNARHNRCSGSVVETTRIYICIHRAYTLTAILISHQYVPPLTYLEI